MNLTCNATLEELIISPGSEIPISGSLTFHQLALIIGGTGSIIAIILSFYLAWRHAFNYTKPREQRHIIRILLMVPVYATASFLQIWFYKHAIYYQVISDCYGAFAVASFFALLCHYVAPTLHEQKGFFRNLYPIKRWVLPLSWFARCCGGERGPWRTPRSGLTWFNIIWVSVYQYCFIRVAMTITAVVTQYFGRYCESSNSPVFAHIWVILINGIAVIIAMYCIIQFYIQLRNKLSGNNPFLKVLSIKLVIFLSFWQTIAISIGTSTLHIVHPNRVLAYPDIKVGIPALLLCIEMAFFAVLHLWAFPYAPYVPGTTPTYYPTPDDRKGDVLPRENEHQPPSGGFMGLKAFGDALNLWDLMSAFGRGMRWLFCGVKRRTDDPSYNNLVTNTIGMDDLSYVENNDTSYDPLRHGAKSNNQFPITSEFPGDNSGLPAVSHDRMDDDDREDLIAHTQPNPEAGWTSPENHPVRPIRQPVPHPYRDATVQDGSDLEVRPQEYREEEWSATGSAGVNRQGIRETRNDTTGQLDDYSLSTTPHPAWEQSRTPQRPV